MGGNVGGRGWAGWSGVKGGKWVNCNSIINKYILKNNLKGNNNRVNEAENEINVLEYKEAKNNQSEQQEEKISPKMGIM